MALEPIGDIANPSLTDNTAITLTWDTAADWDAAVDESTVIHEDDSNRDVIGSGTIELGFASYDYNGSSLVALWHFNEDSGSTVYDPVNGQDFTVDSGNPAPGAGGILGRTAWRLDGNDWFGQDVSGDPLGGYAGDSWTVIIYNRPETGDDTDNYGHMLSKGASSTDDYECPLYQDSIYARWIIGGTLYNPSGTSTITYDQWQCHGWRYDYGNNFTLWQNGSQTYSSSASGDVNDSTNDLQWGHEVGGSRDQQYKGRAGVTMVFSRSLSDTEMGELMDPTSGYLTTATKSYSTAQTPDLSNLTYALNAGGITLDVIGSPGTASEEIVSQTLDGASSYSLTWSNSHTDFRIKVNMTVPSFTGGTPSLSAMTLNA